MGTHGTGFSVYTSAYKYMELKNNYVTVYVAAHMCSISELSDRF